jgi:hypothetical protein
MRNGLIGLASAMLLAPTMAVFSCADYSGGNGVPAATSGGSSSSGGQQSAGGAATGGAANGGAANGGSSSATGGGSSCPAGNPCGGDLVGTWKVTSSCLTVSGEVNILLAGIGCTRAAATGSLKVDGKWTVSSDGTFTDATTTSGDQQLKLEPKCLDVSGTKTTCGEVSAAFVAVGYPQANCTSSADGGCNCTAHAQQDGGFAFVSGNPLTEGMYSIKDNVVTNTDGRTTQNYSYCVTSGSSLTMIPQPANPTLTGTIVFQKE